MALCAVQQRRRQASSGRLVNSAHPSNPRCTVSLSSPAPSRPSTRCTAIQSSSAAGDGSAMQQCQWAGRGRQVAPQARRRRIWSSTLTCLCHNSEPLNRRTPLHAPLVHGGVVLNSAAGKVQVDVSPNCRAGAHVPPAAAHQRQVAALLGGHRRKHRRKLGVIQVCQLCGPPGGSPLGGHVWGSLLDLCAQLSGYLGRLHRSLMIANCSKAQSNGETYGSLAMRDICVLQCGEDALPKPCHPQVRLCNIPQTSMAVLPRRPGPADHNDRQFGAATLPAGCLGWSAQVVRPARCPQPYCGNQSDGRGG